MYGGYESVTYFVILITYYIMSLDLFGLKIHEKAKSKYEKHMKIQFISPGRYLAYSLSRLAVRTEVAGSPQVLDLFNAAAAFRAGFSNCVLVHQSDVASRLVIKVDFIIAPAQLGDLRYSADDRIVKYLSLVCSQLFECVFGVQSGVEQDVLGAGITQAGDELLLGQ